MGSTGTDTAMNGFLVIDKPGGMTSHDVVDIARRWFPRKTKVGHTGTLDPLATGVLVLCVGAATRLADLVQAMEKTYVARFRLGATSNTDDADGEVTETVGAKPIPEADVRTAFASFVGELLQVPPAYSAVKVGGRRAYDLARKDDAVELAPRPVQVYSVTLHSFEWPFADVAIECGKGTYIRSIARDLGTRLGCGGLVEQLRRTKIGPFTEEIAVSLSATPEQVRASLLPLSLAARDLPKIVLAPEQIDRLRHGQLVRASVEASADRMAAFGPGGELIGLVSAPDRETIRPLIILNIV